MTSLTTFYLLASFIIIGALLGWASYLAGGKKGILTFVGLFLTTFIPFSITLFGPVAIVIFGITTSMKLVLNLTTVVAITLIVFGVKEHRYGAGLFVLFSLICGILALLAFL